MAWSSTHITWIYQLIILSLLLPPVFVVSLTLAFIAPRLYAPAQARAPRNDNVTNIAAPSFKPAPAERVNITRKAS